jgi:hypothetical protein
VTAAPGLYQHVTLGAGIDYGDIALIEGVILGGAGRHRS